MDFAAPHTGFVIAAYAVSLAGLVLLIALTIARDRRLSREVAELEGLKLGGERR
jgi:heme exporter protein CcmD